MTNRLTRIAEKEIAQHTREYQILAAAGAPQRVLDVYQRAIDRLRHYIHMENFK